MGKQSRKSNKKKENPRHYKLKKAIGNTFQTLRKNAGYSSSEKFANTKNLNRGMYSRYEAGSVDMKITTLLDTAIAHGLSEEDIFNKDFLALGDTSEENTILKNSESTIINQVRNQAKLAASEEAANQLDDSDIIDLHKIMIATLTPSLKKQLLKTIGLKSKTPRFERILTFAIHAKWLMQTHPDNPNHPLQKYYTSELGKKILRVSQEKEN